MKKSNYTNLKKLQEQPLPPGFDTASGPLECTLLNDLMFRIVFEANQEALKALLCSLLLLKREDITELEIKNPIRLGQRIKDKKYIYDIYLQLNNQKKIHLELQVLPQDFWTDRSLCYLCRDFGNLNAGDTYDQVQPLVQIDILDFDLYKDSRKFYSVYHFANDNNGRIYSSKIALHVLQLGKEEYATPEDKAYGIDYWSKLFKATTWEELKKLSKEQENLQSVVETIYRVNADDATLEEIRAREDELRVQRTIQNQMDHLKAKLSEQEAAIVRNAAEIAEQQAEIAEQRAEIASFQNKQKQQISKKILAGKSLEQIAAELEEAPDDIRDIYETLLVELR